MAIFGGGSQKKESTPVVTTNNSATLMTKCIEIKGDIKGCGSIHIDGIVHGNVEVDERVVIGQTGKVYGDVRSKEVIISGELQGTLECKKLEVTRTGVVSHAIKADQVVSDGKVDALIDAKMSVHITQNGVLNTKKLESRNIVVNGHIEGNIIASELLEINKDGRVKGEMTVKKIKVAEGGLMLGTMLTYRQESQPESAPVNVKKETGNAVKEKEDKGAASTKKA